MNTVTEYKEITLTITYKCKMKTPAAAQDINAGVALNQLPLEIGNDILGVKWEIDWDSYKCY